MAEDIHKAASSEGFPSDSMVGSNPIEACYYRTLDSFVAVDLAQADFAWADNIRTARGTLDSWAAGSWAEGAHFGSSAGAQGTSLLAWAGVVDKVYYCDSLIIYADS